METTTHRTISKEFQEPISFFLGAEIGPETIITKLFYKTEQFVIYEVNHSKQVDYLTKDDNRYNTKAISTQLARISFWLYDSNARIDPFLETIADAMALCFRNEASEALVLVSQLEKEVKTEVYKWSKLIYLFPCVLFTLAIGLFVFVLDTRCNWFFCGCAIRPELLTVIHMMALGSAGGLLSIARNLDSYNVEVKRYKSKLRTLAGPYLVGVMVRMVVAVLGSIFLLVLYRSQLISIKGFEAANPYGLYVLGILGGFSQNLVPGLLTRFETNLGSDQPVRIDSRGNMVGQNQMSGPTTPTKSTKPANETNPDRADNVENP